MPALAAGGAKLDEKANSRASRAGEVEQVQAVPGRHGNGARQQRVDRVLPTEPPRLIEDGLSLVVPPARGERQAQVRQ